VYSAIENSVELKGHVKQEGMKAFYIGMRVSDLVQNAGNLKDKVDMDYALIRRMVPPANEIEVMSFNLRQALNNPGSLDNKTLQTGDTIYIFERGIDRNAIIDPLIEELEQQSGNGVLLKQVSVGGRVKVPGDYPLEAVMTISDLIRAGGGLTDAAYRLEAELTRDALDHNSELEKEHIKIDLKRLLEGDRTADVMLQSRDRLYIKEVPNWREDNAIELMGEVQFPGEYYIKSGETLGQVMQRAGGLSDNAFAKGTLFIRDSLKEKENKFLATLADNLEKDIAMLSIEKESSAVDLGKSLLEQLRSAEAIGRLVIDLDSVMANIGNEFKDVILQNGDKILVPGKTQEVTVIGEVQFPTSHLHDGNNSRNAYLQKSGGFTAKADAKRVYIVRADGSVVGRESTAWFSRNEYIDIQPGDTIVVPLDSDRVRPLTLWTSVTQILYQLGIFAAAAKTVGVL
jgi:protein involved in polysaccharide export with SLBB domain